MMRPTNLSTSSAKLNTAPAVRISDGVSATTERGAGSPPRNAVERAAAASEDTTQVRWRRKKFTY